MIKTLKTDDPLKAIEYQFIQLNDKLDKFFKLIEAQLSSQTNLMTIDTDNNAQVKQLIRYKELARKRRAYCIGATVFAIAAIVAAWFI